MRAALGASHGALRRTLLAESLVLCGAGAVLGVLLARPLVTVVAGYACAFLGSRARSHRRRQPALGWRRPGDGCGRAARVHSAPPVAARVRRARAGQRQPPHHARHEPPAAGVRDDADCVLVRAARRRRHAARDARRAADSEHRLRPAAGAGVRSADAGARRSETRRRWTSTRRSRGESASCRGVRGCRARQLRAVA